MNRLVEEPMRMLKKRAMRGTYHEKLQTPEDPASGRPADPTPDPAPDPA
jgi:hypothetical protein